MARAAVLTVGLAAQLAAVTVGVLPAPALLISAPLLVLLAQAHRTAWAKQIGTMSTVVAAMAVVASLPSLEVSSGSPALKGQLGGLLLFAQLAQAAGWRAPRDLRVGLLTGGGMLVLSASYAPDVLVGLPLIVGWVAMLVALAQLAGLRGRALAPPAAMAMVLGLVAFLVLPVPKSALHHGGASGQGVSDTYAQRTTQGAVVFSEETLDLNLRGPLSKVPVLTVSSDSPSLWRSTVYSAYTSDGWTRGSPSTQVTGRTLQLTTATGPVHTWSATPSDADGGSIFSPGRIISYSTSQKTQGVSHADGDLEVYPSVPYVVTAQDPVTAPAALTRTTGADVGDAQWTVLPATVPVRDRELARQITAGTRTRWAAAQAITGWLHANVKYSLTSPIPGQGEDAVDHVLFIDHVGFCEQFASAETVLLRSIGIPARLVTGLAYGTDKGAVRSYTAKDLHAWVELWVPGTGWVTSDPTAGSTLAPAAALGVRARVAAQISKVLRATTSVPGGRPALAGLILALAVVVGGLAVSRRTRTVVVRPAGPAGPALAAYLRLNARLGEQARRPSESVREHGARLDPSLASALEVVEQELYAPVVPATARAVEVLDRS